MGKGVCHKVFEESHTARKEKLFNATYIHF